MKRTLAVTLSAFVSVGIGRQPPARHVRPEPERSPTTRSVTHLTHTLYARTITLTPDAPRDQELGVKLLRVKPDGTTVIHVSRTGEDLSAAPGRPFLGRRAGRYHVRTFGESGLILLGSDPATQKAVLDRNWAEWSDSIEPNEP